MTKAQKHHAKELKIALFYGELSRDPNDPNTITGREQRLTSHNPMALARLNANFTKALEDEHKILLNRVKYHNALKAYHSAKKAGKVDELTLKQLRFTANHSFEALKIKRSK